jgi:hypothetical protein
MSYTLFSSDVRTAKKEHVCIWCGQKILAGEKYTDERSVYDGNIQRHRWHPECHDDSVKYFRESGEEEFTPWDNERPSLENNEVSHGSAANNPKP